MCLGVRLGLQECLCRAAGDEGNGVQWQRGGMGGRKRRGEGGNMQEREDRKKHRIGKKNALKLLCSLSCCFFLLAKGI